MFWYSIVLILSLYWLVTGAYYLLWGVLTLLGHLLFGVPGGSIPDEPRKYDRKGW